MPNSPKTSSRRRFLRATAATAASVQILPSRIFADSPNEKLNIAFVAAGGRAEANIGGCKAAGANIYALCDVDTKKSAKKVSENPKAKFYRDWREMLEKEANNIDAVVVSTPDHTHAVAAMAAIQLGKHVYCEKPLTRTISEARALRDAARKAGVVTQMGNTGHASEGSRLTNEYIRSGSLGDITEVHCVTNRPIWAQDIVRPEASDPPGNIDWDLWIGPVQYKPYARGIAPFSWRGYIDYGTGALGDMGAHIIDHPVWAFGLGQPESVEVKVARLTPGSELHTHPASCEIKYQFAATDKHGPITLTWYDGNPKDEKFKEVMHRIPRPPGLRSGDKNIENGCVYYGSKHVMMHGSHGGRPKILTNAGSFEAPEKTEERSPGHYKEWIQGCKAGDPGMAKSNFDVGAHLTELMLVGCNAALAGDGTKVTYNAEAMTTGNADVDKWANHDYREGWAL